MLHPIFGIDTGNFPIYYVMLFIALFAGVISFRKAFRKQHYSAFIYKRIKRSFFRGAVWGLICSNVITWIVHEEIARLPFFDRITQGGYSIYFGLIGFFAFSALFMRLYNLDITYLINKITRTVLIAHFIARLGCSLKGCCFGDEAELFGLTFHIPVREAEAVLALTLAVIPERFIFRKRAALYLFSYSLFRLISDFFRGDESGTLFGINALSPIQLASFAVVIVTGVILFTRPVFRLIKKEQLLDDAISYIKSLSLKIRSKLSRGKAQKSFYPAKYIPANKKKPVGKIIISLVLVVAIPASGILALTGALSENKLQMLSGEGQFATVTGKFTDIKIKNSDSAIEAAKEVSQNLGILQAADELSAKGESSFDGTNYYRLQQNFNGIPVYGRDIVVLAGKNGTSQGVMSNLLDIPSDFEINTSAEHEAINRSILSYFSDTLEITSDSVIIPEIQEEDLVIYSIDENKEIYSAYCLNVYAGTDSYTVIVDSSDAKVLLATPDNINENIQSTTDSDMTFEQTMTLSFNEMQSICNEMNVKIFNAEGGEINRYLELRDSDGNLFYFNLDTKTYTSVPSDPNNISVIGMYFTKASDNSRLPEINENMDSGHRAKARLVMCSAINTIDFYRTVLGRNSFDNKNGYLPIVLDDNMGNDITNAYSCSFLSCTMISIGRACNISVDLVAHEFTHSVISTECDLVYQAESGALNEGLADIFGELSEDWSDGVLNNSCDWIHNSRNLISPTSGGDPAEYEGENWGPIWQLGDDHGHVHKNSTVISHAAYLMNSGTGGTTPIPTETLSKLFYRTILTLPSNASFSCFRQHVEDNARLMKLSRAYKETIKAAFDEVGIENGAADIKNYGKEFDLTVYDINAEEYTKYTLKIEGKYRDSTGALREYNEEGILCTSSPMTVSLENFGTYLLTVSDLGSSNKTYSKLITVTQLTENESYFKETELKILTSFGDPFFDSGSNDEYSVRLKGQLRDTITNSGISGASVTVVMDENGTSYTLTTDSNGYYQVNVKPGLYYITCSATGYNQTYSSALVEKNTTIRKPILLLWTDERFINNPIEYWPDTLFTYIDSVLTRAIESMMWGLTDNALREVIEEIPLLEDLLNRFFLE